MIMNYEELQINYENLLKLGYVVVDIRFKDYDVLPETMKLVISRADMDRDEFYQSMLKQYTSVEFKTSEVFEVWTDILKHKVKMSNILNRDIAIKVAALDYIETVYSNR